MSDIRDQNRDPTAQRPQAPRGPAAGTQSRSIVVREPPRSATDSLVLGELVRHGRAPYTFQPNGEPSYFVTLKTERRDRPLRSRGLERALAESRTQPQAGES